MTDEQINTAIAESLGFYLKDDKWYKDQGVSRTYYASGIKYYTTDLNACHEFEKTLDTREKWLKYINSLWDLCGLSKYKLEHPPLIHAEARHKCEAYLRTIGKWEEVA